MKKKILKLLPKKVKRFVTNLHNTLSDTKDSNRVGRFEVLRRSVETESPVIIDGGAHEGRVTDTFKGIFQLPTIYACEPIPSYAHELTIEYKNDKNVHICQCALGSDNSNIDINIYERESLTSPLKLSQQYEQSRQLKSNIEKRVTVPKKKIDSITTKADIIKLDIQGYEIEALKGAKEALKNCKSLLVETSFERNYEGRSLFKDVHEFLHNEQFNIFDIYGIKRGVDGQISTVRVVYLDKKVYEGEEFVANPFKYR